MANDKSLVGKGGARRIFDMAVMGYIHHLAGM